MTVNLRTCFWLALSLCFSSASTQGQDCPSVEQALKELHAATDEGGALHRRIEQSCPGYLDTLSLLYHQRTVYAFNAGQPWSVTIGFALKTLAVQRELYADREEVPLGKTLANLGFAYRRAGQPARAMPYLKEADGVFKKLEDRSLADEGPLANIRARRYRNRLQMVYALQTTGDYGQAKSVLEVMLATARESGSSGQLAEILRLKGVQANGEENYAAALPWLKESVAISAERGGIRGEVEGRAEQARSLFYLKRYDEAERAALAGLAVAADYALNYDKALLHNQLALIHNQREEFAAARAAIGRGQDIIAGEDRGQLEVLLLGNLARIAATEGKGQEALNLNAEAIAALVPGWNYSEESSLPTGEQLAATTLKVDLFELLGERVEYLEQVGAAAGAMEVVRAGDDLADLLRTDFSGQTSKLFWRREALPVYEAGIRLSHAAGDAEAAFYFLEKSRAILLLEGLVETAARAQIDPAIAAELSGVENQLQAFRLGLLNGEGTAENRLRILGLTDTLGSLRAQLAERYPAVGGLLLRPELVGLSEARANLAAAGWDRQVHFFLGNKHTYAFELSPTTARTIDLGIATDSLESSLRHYLSFFTGPTAIDNDPASFLSAGYRVYRQLFTALNTEPGERLLVLPDGLLTYLPFNSLVTAPGATDLAVAPYLIRRNKLSFAQSATVLARQQENTNTTGMAFAFSPFGVESPNKTAPALPFSKVETDALANAYTTTLLEGAAASREALLSAGMENNSIIHLSTHAYATATGAETPRILTATDPVFLSDVQSFQLDASLVVLSACESNIGPLAKGEGVLGLGRAFAAAGARGVVASLWPLNDRATADVVSSFYEILATGKSKPTALHEAQLAYLDRADVPAYLKSPYYWAGLVYYGDGGSLPAGGLGWFWPLLGLATLGIVIAGYLAFRLKSSA